MFNQFTWSDFFLTLLVVLLFYYAALLYFFYRKDILVRLIKPRHAATPFAFHEQGKETHDSAMDENDAYLLQACTDEITAYLQEAKGKNCLKAELLVALGRILQKYAPRLDEALKTAITNVLKTQCEGICAIHLHEDEVKAVWMKSE